MVIWKLSSGGVDVKFFAARLSGMLGFTSKLQVLGIYTFSRESCIHRAHWGLHGHANWKTLEQGGLVWSWASQSERFLMFPGIHGWFSDEPSMPRGTLDIICLRGTFPAGFLPSLSNISIKTASKEISWENHNVDGTNPAGIVVLDRNNSKLAGDTFGGLGNTCRVV